MAHRYGLPIQVHCHDSSPVSFTWRAQTFHIVEVLSTWHLQDRWWVSGVSVALGQEARPKTDRVYYRVQAQDFQIFDLYHDTENNMWVLDVVQD